MKRALVIVLLVVFAVSACDYAWWAAEQSADLSFGKEKISRYFINCFYDEVEKIIKGYQQITYYNNEESILEDIYVHLYPNYFSNEESTPFSVSELHMAYPGGFDPGFINIDRLQVEGQNGSWKYTDNTNRVLRIELSKPLKPGDFVVIEMNYTVKLPRCNGRFGYGDKTVKAANWYPVVAVFDSRGWNLDPYYSIGDPFYCDVSDYQVNITIPEDYIVASTGEVLESKKSSKGLREWRVKAENVRDFAWVASKEFKVKEKGTGNITVKSYFFQEDGGEKALDVAVEAIEIFSEMFGPYPYKTYSVVAADFYVGGMEYPNLVLIDRELYNKGSLFSLEYVVAHETAHQWWYGVIGSNEVREPWLDEGLTEYSTILYYEKRYGSGTAEGIMNNLIGERYREYKSKNRLQDSRILNSLGEYNNSQEYHTLVYCGGAMIIHKLRKTIGEQKFFNALKTYYKTYAFENATTKDFIDVIEHVSDLELENKIMEWLLRGV